MRVENMTDREIVAACAVDFRRKAQEAYDAYQSTGMTRYDNAYHKYEALADALDRDVQKADTRQAAYEARVQTYRDKRKSEEEAARLAASIQPAANANEHGTGYAADILSADDPQQNTSFAETRTYEWLTAYAAEYGFILRYPQDRQASCSSRGTGAMWGWKTPLPSAPAA